MTRPQRAARVSAEAREPRRELELLAPHPARCCDYGGDCGCDDDDEPSAADLQWSDAREHDRECRRSLSW